MPVSSCQLKATHLYTISEYKSVQCNVICYVPMEKSWFRQINVKHVDKNDILVFII